MSKSHFGMAANRRIKELEAELKAMTIAAGLYQDCIDDLKELDPITIARCLVAVDDDVLAAIKKLRSE